MRRQDHTQRMVLDGKHFRPVLLLSHCHRRDNKTTALPSCAVSDAWLATLEDELGPDTSALAR